VCEMPLLHRNAQCNPADSMTAGRAFRGWRTDPRNGLFYLWDSRARCFPLDLFLYRLDEILELMADLSTCFDTLDLDWLGIQFCSHSNCSGWHTSRPLRLRDAYICPWCLRSPFHFFPHFCITIWDLSVFLLLSASLTPLVTGPRD